MITLHNAIVPFDGDPINIEDPKTIKVMTVDHTQPTADCTRVMLDDGSTFLVTESVDEIQAMIDEAKS